MNISDIRIRKILNGGRMKVVASVTFDEDFVVHDMKIIEGAEGLFLAMPSRRVPDGSFRDIAHPINMKTRKCLEDAVIAEYHKSLQEKEDLEENAPREDVHEVAITLEKIGDDVELKSE